MLQNKMGRQLFFYFIIKRLKNQDNVVKSCHLGLFVSLQRCEVRGYGRPSDHKIKAEQQN